MFMKVGIITWFKYENYGTVLQAIALQRYLRNIGHQVELLNFELDDSASIKKRNKLKITSRVYFKLAKILYDLQKKFIVKNLKKNLLNLKK